MQACTKWPGTTLALLAVISGLSACGDGRRSGSGEYAREVLYCQDQIFADAQQPEGMAFPEEYVWHSGDKAELLVGGLVSLPSGMQQPVYFDYQCLLHDGRMVYARME